MTVCINCGHDPENFLCKFCGEANQTLAKFGEKLLTICCHKDPFEKTPETPQESPVVETTEGGK